MINTTLLPSLAIGISLLGAIIGAVAILTTLAISLVYWTDAKDAEDR